MKIAILTRVIVGVLLVGLCSVANSQQTNSKQKPRTANELYALYQERNEKWQSLQFDKRKPAHEALFGD